MPQWQVYLQGKLSKEVQIARMKKKEMEIRTDTIWKKILRDIREFYRLLFKARFHPLEYKQPERRLMCLKLLLKDLGLPLPTEEILASSFPFFY